MSILIESAVCLSITNERTEYHHFTRRMSNSGLTSEAQLRYVLQWFGEFSELQREDFLPVLAAAHGDNPELLANALASLSCRDKPMSLFQCRLKLFDEWYPTWSEEERDRLFKAIAEIDSAFGSKLQDSLMNGVQVNGEMNGDPDMVSEVAEEHIDTEQQDNANDNAENVLSQENSIEITATS